MKPKNTEGKWFSPRTWFSGLVRVYQVCISPLLGPSCRFYPTCSNYSIQAIQKFGVIKGIYLTAYRLARCQPLSRGGVDFPPDEFSWNLARCVCPEPKSQPTETL